MSRPNVFADGPWDVHEEEMQINGQLVGKAAGAKELGMSVYDLLPGSSGFNLHFHNGIRSSARSASRHAIHLRRRPSTETRGSSRCSIMPNTEK